MAPSGARVVRSVTVTTVFGIRPTDPLVYVVPLAILAAGGCVAALIPALKAARIDPVMTLRSE